MDVVSIIILALSLTAAENVTAGNLKSKERVSDSEELKAEMAEEREWRSDGDRSNWSPWSPWSTCSRLCDGGVSYQLRRCRSLFMCHGEAIRYKICNMQPCPEPVDFRERQCAAFNDVPYDDQFLRWSAHYDQNEPCALTCRGRPNKEGTQDDDDMIVVQLASKVQDGTRCRPGSLDMCINGKCLRVGCDLRIGSNKKVDDCGVCGGDSTSCSQPAYDWEEEPASLCSASCGGGYKMSRSVCRNKQSGEEVDENLCDKSQKPSSKIVECNVHACPAKWTVREWSPCSVSCGGGSRSREVFCSEEVNTTKIKVPEHRCSGSKPHYQEQCETRECPKWVVSEWSGCSVSCGEGVQTRSISCKEGFKISSSPCDESRRPGSVRPCETGIPCPEPRPRYTETGTTIDWDSMPDPEGEFRQPLLQPYPPSIFTDSGALAATAEKLVGDKDGHGSPSDATAGSNGFLSTGIVPGVSRNSCSPNIFQKMLRCGIFSRYKVFFACGWLYVSFIPEKWGPCSVTCGEGMRKREVECKIFLELTKAIARLPDEQCHGPKPATTERCVRESCPSEIGMETFEDGPISDHYSYGSSQAQKKVKVAPESSGKTYSWKQQGFTHCSASCLGGVQESIINCVRDDDQKVVVPLLCPTETRPESLIRTCNDQPCPPRWNYSDFQPCSKPCGIGIQTRDINCIHEVTRGGGTTVVVPNNMCPQPPPPDRQYCNVLDCPVKWHTSDWSKCSKPCGGGLKTRTVQCRQVMAQNHIMDRPISMCPATKPPDKKPCNTKSCVETDRPVIATAVNQTYVQASAAKKRVTLKIGGTAQVFFGTQVKIKCPVKRYDRSKIQWAKDHKYIQQTKKYRISRKGALKINNVTRRDSGIYTCVASRSTADITLTVKPLPGHFPNSEEIHHGQNNVENPSFFEPNSDSGDLQMGQHKPFLMPGEDDLSHEFKPDGIVPTKKPRARKTRPTPTNPINEVSQSSNQRGTVQKLWPPYLSTTLVSDQEQDQNEEFSGNPSGSSPPGPGAPSTSGSSRPMPHFQQLLSNLQTFANSRGHLALVADMIPSQRTLFADHPGPFPFLDDEESTKDVDPETMEEEYGTAVVLGKGNPKNLKFEWTASPWSSCSESCGENGFQMRTVHCSVKLHNITHVVKNNLCDDAGLVQPTKIQKCGSECPSWSHGPWSLCEDAKCFTWNTATQNRDVDCAFANGTKVNDSFCEKSEKPLDKQECYNDNCKGTWRVGNWSECAAECEKEGIKYRILQCVWYGTQKPAGTACRDQPRPSVMKLCKGPPCGTVEESCKDHSKYCHSILAKNLCRIYRFQTQCCHTCRGRYLNLG